MEIISSQYAATPVESTGISPPSPFAQIKEKIKAIWDRVIPVLIDLWKHANKFEIFPFAASLLSIPVAIALQQWHALPVAVSCMVTIVVIVLRKKIMAEKHEEMMTNVKNSLNELIKPPAAEGMTPNKNLEERLEALVEKYNNSTYANKETIASNLQRFYKRDITRSEIGFKEGVGYIDSVLNLKSDSEQCEEGQKPEGLSEEQRKIWVELEKETTAWINAYQAYKDLSSKLEDLQSDKDYTESQHHYFKTLKAILETYQKSQETPDRLIENVESSYAMRNTYLPKKEENPPEASEAEGEDDILLD